MSSTRSYMRNRELEKESISCKYRTEMESNLMSLVFECRACDGKSNLKDSTCMREVLGALKLEFSADSIVFSDYIETRYFGPVVEILRRMANILNEIARFALRKPWEVRSYSRTSEQSEQRKMCAGCKLNPSMMFDAMKKGGEKSLEHLLKIFNKCLVHVTTFNPQGICITCVEATKGDMRYVQKLLEELRAYILYQAFKILEGDS